MDLAWKYPGTGWPGFCPGLREAKKK